MKLAILGGGGVRMPAFVRALLSAEAKVFDEISLFEPDAARRQTTGRLAVELARALGSPGVVTLTSEVEEAFTGCDFVFSAIRVGGDQGRVIDEQVALERGLVGQETTGPGGAAMALRTIPVVLSYCEALARCSPRAVLVNFTNPAGVITQAISSYGAGVRAVGVCDTPGGTVARLAAFLGAELATVSSLYSGLNHLGWISSVRVEGEERLGELLARYEDLQRFDHRFAAFDPDMVRRVGAVPTEYVFYYYDPRRYVEGVARAGTSRGQDVLRLNEELLSGIVRAFDKGDVEDAWSAYSLLMGVRHDTYMRTDTEGASRQAEARSRRVAAGPELLGKAEIGGYEGVALRVIGGLSSRQPARVIVNTPNGTSMPWLDPDDVVEVPALVDGGGLHPLAAGELPSSARGLVAQVKEYERTLVEAAVTGDAALAELALSLHPLVPGLSAARELLGEYRRRHGKYLEYLR
ncbi:MAG: 6-phospho-beta-glucosidase [Acidimicrobiales bacterium]